MRPRPKNALVGILVAEWIVWALVLLIVVLVSGNLDANMAIGGSIGLALLTVTMGGLAWLD